MRYDPAKIEKKWHERWQEEGIYEPDLKSAKRPFYNLMMFPYPSAEGLHVGNMYAFVGADIYGRFKRMQGHDVFEPMGLDGFGIHSENYAIKIGRHPVEQAKISEKNFYRQLEMIGNGFAWREKLETYDPEYYKWTQWIFVQMFKRGLAYRKKASVNWCPSCKTVLADEQVIAGKCERCGTIVVKKELEQWFFRITNYAERLRKNLEKIDWSEKIKIAQRNWIGKSEGAEIGFEICLKEKPNFVLLHGYHGTPKGVFFPWAIKELQKRGYLVQAPVLPNSNNPDVEEQAQYVLRHVKFDRNTVLFGHSLGARVALRVAENLEQSLSRLILAAGRATPGNTSKGLPAYDKNFNWRFNFGKIQKNCSEVVILRDVADDIVPFHKADELQRFLGGRIVDCRARRPHFCDKQEPDILNALVPRITVFTTRPDTLFGATYMVVAPEHPLIKNQESRIKNQGEVKDYVKKARDKTEDERIADGKEKTGVELKGIKAVNPATKEEIPIWVADYVLGGVGTGAIMAVPAHDERDFEFAQKYNLPIKIVVCPHYPAKTCPVLERAYVGPGHLVDSGRFSGVPFEEAKWEITKFVGGERKTQYRLRDWLISRQRYWGAPIPMIYCEKCKWQPVPERDLPVQLPYIKDFRPTGTDKSPLAAMEKFYKVRCPKCKSWARRETDVSDTFLDSAWYYLGYLILGGKRIKDKRQKFTFDKKLLQKWLPVDMYIGGAEHAVLHLLYVRFLAMAFYDWGLTHFEEPFKKFRAHGLLIKDGAKMSKSRGNVVNPDEYIRAYGADALRMYLMFLGPFEQGGDFRDTGIRGITRFLERVWKLCAKLKDKRQKIEEENSNLTRTLHRTIKKVTEDIESLQCNTAISALMVLLNEFEHTNSAPPPPGSGNANAPIRIGDIKTFLKLLAPFAPFIAEELWHSFATSYKLQATSIHKAPWPKYDPKFVREETFELVIQVNGKVRGRATISVGTGEAEAKKAALGFEGVRKFVPGDPKKIIFVPGKLINFVV